MGVLLLSVNIIFFNSEADVCLRLIAKPDEMGTLGRFVAIDHRNAVGNDAHLMSCPGVREEL